MDRLLQLSLISANQYHFLENAPVLIESLLHHEFVAQEKLYRIISEIIGYPFIDLDTQPLHDLFPFEFCKQNHFVVFSYDDHPALAMSDPYDVSIKDLVRKKCPIEQIFLASPQNIDYFLHYASTNTTPSGDKINDLITQALLAGASDIHFQPETTVIHVYTRVDGILKSYETIALEDWTRLINQFKVRALLDITETRRPQNGRFQGYYAGMPIDCRISIHPTIKGESVVLRLLKKDQKIFKIEQLGFSEKSIRILRALIEKPSGLFLITGPTGSGKTTTLYSLFDHINDGSRKIMTLEEPVEYNLKGITQTEIQVIDYADGIKSILRQDPDVIFIGEIRDEVTAKMALRASITGHLVCATLHTYDALASIIRLNDLGISRELLATQLSGILSQRLVRCICPNCKKQGCAQCQNSGFRGRTVLHELLPVDSDIKDWLTQDISYQKLYKKLIEEKNFQPFAIHAQELIEKNITTDTEIQRIL